MITRDQWAKIKEVVVGERTDLGITVNAGCRNAGCTVKDFNALLKISRERRPADEVWVWDVAETMETVDQRRGMVFLDEMVVRAMNGWEETTYVNQVPIKSVSKKDNKMLDRLVQRFDPTMRPAAQKAQGDPDNPDPGKEKTFATAEEAFEAMERVRNWTAANRTDEDDVEDILGGRKLDGLTIVNSPSSTTEAAREPRIGCRIFLRSTAFIASASISTKMIGRGSGLLLLS